MKNKNFGFYLEAAAALFTLLALIFCIITGTNEDDLTVLSIVMLCIAFVAELVGLYRDFFGIPALLGAVCTAIGIVSPVVVRLNMIGLIFSGVVEQELWTALILAVVFGLIAVVLECVVGFTGTTKKTGTSDKENAKAKANA